MDQVMQILDPILKILLILVPISLGWCFKVSKSQALDHESIHSLETSVTKISEACKSNASNIATVTQLLMVLDSQHKSAERDGGEQWKQIESMRTDMTDIKVSVAEIRTYMRSFHKAINRRMGEGDPDSSGDSMG